MLNDAFQHYHEQDNLNNYINSTYTQYEVEMIKKYKNEVSYEELEIYKDKNIYQFQFVDQLKVKSLVLYGCFSIVFDKVPDNIVELTVNECKLKNILGIQFMTKLKRLDLSNNVLIDIQPLYSLEQLQSLHINENKLVNIQPLSTLKQLQSLSLTNNRIIDLQPVKSLGNLLSLDLSHNSIKSVLCLQNLTHLQSLNLSFNNIQDITGFTCLSSLQTLNLDYNLLIDISPLTHLPLRSLDIYSNRIVDVCPISSHQFEHLFMSNNYITNAYLLSNHKQFSDYSLNNQNPPTKSLILFQKRLKAVYFGLKNLNQLIMKRTQKILNGKQKINVAVLNLKMELTELLEQMISKFGLL
ncbi:Conserved_hypothetical protein [Hexamita inflata]|uniref:Uncharacterized protein n=1 Tax=Hexamita inflata TaxID=28002 RepID=A0ABP1GRP7_9EUKA